MLAAQSEFLQQNSKRASSPLNRLGPYVWPEHKRDPSPRMNELPWWEDSQTQWRRQCPLVHYHLLCTTCKTLIPEYCTPNDPSAELKSINFSTLSQAVQTPANPCLCLQGYRL